MSIGARIQSSASCCCSATSWSSPRTSFSCEATTRTPASTASTASTTSVSPPSLRQAQVQPQDLEVLPRCLQRHAGMCSHRRQDYLHARRTQPRPQLPLGNRSHQETHRSARSRPALRPPLVRSQSWNQGLGRKLKRNQLYLRRRCRGQIFEGLQHWFSLQGASGSLRGVWVQLE